MRVVTGHSVDISLLCSGAYVRGMRLHLWPMFVLGRLRAVAVRIHHGAMLRVAPFYCRCYSTLRYRVTLSTPTPQKPVPEAEAHVHFLLSSSLLNHQRTARSGQPQNGAGNAKQLPPAETKEQVEESGDESPQVVFWFETQNVKHTLKQTLPQEKLEGWIDRIIEAKLQLRQENQLRTPFEATRMNAGLEDIEELVREQKEACLQQEAEAEEAAHSATTREAIATAATKAARQADRERNFDVKGQLTPRMLYEAPPEKLCIEEVLQKVLNAADEDREGKLPHKTVAGVLRASPLGLQRWDLALLLAAAAHEGRDGYIRYSDFVEEAPDIIRLLRERRKMADQRICSERVTDDAVFLLYKDEMEETWRIMRDIFEAAEEGAAATGKLPRGTFLECLQSRPERLALREVTLLMQIAPTDEEGLVEFSAFPIMLRILRRESINHAVLETKAKDLRVEILNALQKALLCMLEFDRAGLVRCDHFLQTVCEVIPPLFDRAQFTKKDVSLPVVSAHVLGCSAECIAKELADAAARAELEELQGLTGGGKSKRKASSKEGNDPSQNGRHDSYDDSEKGEAPDKETVEKTLIHLFTVVDDKRRGTIPLQTFISAMRYWATSGAQQLNPRNSPTGVVRQPHDPLTSAGSTAKAGVKACAEGSSPSIQDTSTTSASSKRTGAVGGGALESSKGAATSATSTTGGVSAGALAVPSVVNPAAGSAAAAAERRYADVVASCKLTVEEITGLIAEAEVDEHLQEITYHEHIKTWIPTVFEIRKSPIFNQLIHNRGDSNAKSRCSVNGGGSEPDAESHADNV